jgi:hypothetical protein
MMIGGSRSQCRTVRKLSKKPSFEKFHHTLSDSGRSNVHIVFTEICVQVALSLGPSGRLQLVAAQHGANFLQQPSFSSALLFCSRRKAAIRTLVRNSAVQIGCRKIEARSIEKIYSQQDFQCPRDSNGQCGIQKAVF